MFEDKAVTVSSGDFGWKFLDMLNEKNVNSSTGLPSLDLLKEIVTAYVEIQPETAKHRLSGKERVVLTLLKLKHNLPLNFLSNLFDCSVSTVSEIIVSTVPILSKMLSSVVTMPSKEEVLSNMPVHFERYQKVRLVLDCTEIPVSQPKCLKCALRVYSYYKKGFTCKYLISVTPAGIIANVSKGYGGRASDNAIFAASGILEQLLPGIDEIMVDQGFLIDELCENHLIGLVRPPFKGKQKQLSKVRTQKIACARVHVERVIQRMKTFRILTTKVLWSLVPLLDDIMVIVAGVTNLSPSILADEKFL
ncbi:uncharacterized protein LOC135392902 [Ornithodoros turicata]|uniref:uncharacterized protein LOC135392902 n=1 Tax=Ornithodoros turicata TaxID=34597 RepID=UPI00313A2171